jgi:formylglycine-generating enzyme required for sulfatase activity
MKLPHHPLHQALYLLFLLLMWAANPAVAVERRVALVIGNAVYQGEKTLSNPGNDATDVAKLLSSMGFNDGRVKPQLNLGRKAMNAAVQDFMNQAESADMAVVYYSGHGMQTGGESFLIPTDAQIQSERDVRSDGIRLGELMEDLESRRIRHTLIVLDACRDNPFRTRTKSGTKGLAPPKEISGAFLVAYATADGKTADDGTGRNGTYTKELLRHLGKPGASLRDAVEDTQLAVEESSKGQQRPKIYGDSAKFRNVYLAGGPGVQVASIRPEPVPQQVPPPAPVQPARPAAPTAGQVIKDCTECPELVVVPAGTFTMGSSAQEQALAITGGLPKAQADRESPQHSVNIQSFAAGKYAVTKGEFGQFVSAKGYVTEAEKGDGCYVWKDNKWQTDKATNWRNTGYKQEDNHPVVCVTWNDAQAYAQWVSQISGKSYRLLSEAEREYAARAGTQSAFWWGESISTTQANYDGNYSYNNSPKGEYRQATVAVSSFKPNPFGLYNVHGNVWEWVEDCFHDNYSGAPTDGSAWTTGNCNGRVLRGGSWDEGSTSLRSAARGLGIMEFRSETVGFRLATNGL